MMGFRYNDIKINDDEIHIFLERKKNLDESQEEKEKLNELMRNNETLYEAYLLKEQSISDIFDEDDYDRAFGRLKEWTKNVSDSNLDPFKKVLNTLRRYSYGIGDYFKHRVTNAGSEGFNTKINIVMRKAYGYWGLGLFRLEDISGLWGNEVRCCLKLEMSRISQSTGILGLT